MHHISLHLHGDVVVGACAIAIAAPIRNPLIPWLKLLKIGLSL
jgi:hypothetical protein